jgi:CRISP-associated protein Cas1
MVLESGIPGIRSYKELAGLKGEYQGKEVLWSYVLLLKVRGLAHYRVGKKRTLDFLEPEYDIDRQDSIEMRKKIRDIPYVGWKKKGFSRRTRIT